MGAAVQTDAGLLLVVLQMPAVSQFARPKTACATALEGSASLADICFQLRPAAPWSLAFTCSTPTAVPGESVVARLARSIQG